MTWGFRVRDPNKGKDVVVAGELGDGTYGFAMVNDLGQLVKLSQLAFGPRAAEIPTRESMSSTPYSNLATVGPVASDVVIGDTGRCIVTVSAFIEIQLLKGYAIRTASGFMGFEVSGPTPLSPDDARAVGQSMRYDNYAVGGENTNTDLKLGASRTMMLTGLAPGIYTFIAKYRADAAGDPTYFSDRSIVVQPF